MRNSLIQTVLGLLVLVSAFIYSRYIFWGYYTLYRVDINTGRVMQEIINWPGIILNVRNQFMPFYLVLGSIILACALAQLALSMRMKNSTVAVKLMRILGLVQGMLGILLILLFVRYLTQIEPQVPWPDIASDPQTGLFRGAAWSKLLLSWKLLNFLFGLGLIGLGIMQIRWTRFRSKFLRLSTNQTSRNY